ncbi:MAG: flavodoxin-dependent (E)-4-hydroxy-3-methylbut-2-enyl-diphosphate synthase [Myxococcales bacterium]
MSLSHTESGQPLTARRPSRQIKLGELAIGGGAPITVQTMATTDTRDFERTVDQLRQLQAAGADIVRVAVPDMDAAKNLGALQQSIKIPLIADIHFDYHLAMEALAQGVQGIRLNPGNIGGQTKVREVAKLARERKVPIRVGVNAGSLEKRLLAKYGHATPEAMVESARDEVRWLEDEGFLDIKISLKASDVPTAVRAYRLAAKAFDYPLHLGITESGTLQTGSIKSAAGLGILLAEGIGDTIRISLAADPIEEVRVGIQLLKSLGLRRGGLTFVACPTCGRCSVDMIPVAERVEKRLQVVQGEIHVAVMGCEVNGPGEAKEADIGIAYGHNGVGLLFKKGKIVKRMNADELEGILVEEARKIAQGEDGPLEASEAVAPTPPAVLAKLHPTATDVLANTRF